MGMLYQDQCSTASDVRGIVILLLTLGLDRAQMNLVTFVYYNFITILHIRLHCGGSTSNSLSSYPSHIYTIPTKP